MMKRGRRSSGTPRYLGANNIAGMKWCHQKFLFRARANEEMFRRAYEEDCKRLGAGLTVQELDDRLREADHTVVALSDGRAAVVTKDGGGLTAEEVEAIRADFEGELGRGAETSGLFWAEGGIGIELADTLGTMSWERRGRLAEHGHAEHLPSVRYHFRFGDYIIIAAPDGIAPEYCYEFKLIRDPFWLAFEKPVAVAQARLYSYFFERKRYKAEIYNEREARKETVEGRLNRRWVEELLATMDRLLTGSMTAWPPKPVKCPSCEFSEDCPIRQT